jgi:hypothetical protein
LIGHHGKDVFHLVGDSWSWVASYGKGGFRTDPNRMDENLGNQENPAGYPTDMNDLNGASVYGI